MRNYSIQELISVAVSLTRYDMTAETTNTESCDRYKAARLKQSEHMPVVGCNSVSVTPQNPHSGLDKNVSHTSNNVQCIQVKQN